jgi:hypothetical protein
MTGVFTKIHKATECGTGGPLCILRGNRRSRDGRPVFGLCICAPGEACAPDTIPQQYVLAGSAPAGEEQRARAERLVEHRHERLSDGGLVLGNVVVGRGRAEPRAERVVEEDARRRGCG